MANTRLEYIKGLDEFLDALRQLPKNIGQNVLRGAVNAGAAVLQKEAVHLAPEYEGDDKRVTPGRIKDAIYRKQIPELSNDLLQTFHVGVRRGKKASVKVVKGKVTNLDAYYWTWVEFGHFYVPPGIQSGKGSHAKNKAHRDAAHKFGLWVEPRSFMRPAFAIAKDQALQAMQDYMAKRIPLEAQKLGLVMR